jgi:hypothetical protein
VAALYLVGARLVAGEGLALEHLGEVGARLLSPGRRARL